MGPEYQLVSHSSIIGQYHSISSILTHEIVIYNLYPWLFPMTGAQIFVGCWVSHYIPLHSHDILDVVGYQSPFPILTSHGLVIVDCRPFGHGRAAELPFYLLVDPSQSVDYMTYNPSHPQSQVVFQWGYFFPHYGELSRSHDWVKCQVFFESNTQKDSTKSRPWNQYFKFGFYQQNYLKTWVSNMVRCFSPTTINHQEKSPVKSP